jgi:hypothetical protein
MIDIPDPTAVGDARDRVAEITRLFRRIRALLDHSLRISDDLRDDTPKALLQRMDQLIAAHLRVLAAEEAFLATQHSLNPDDSSLDSIRHDLGRRLDRLRASFAAKGISEHAD